MRIDILKIYTSYNKNGQVKFIKFVNCKEAVMKFFSDNEDKSNFYFLSVNISTGQCFFRGRRKQIYARLIDFYFDPKESKEDIKKEPNQIYKKYKDKRLGTKIHF